MPTHRPSRPQPARPRRATFAAPLLVASQLVVVSAAAVLANFSWTSAYEPNPYRREHPRHHDRDTDAPADGQEPGNQHDAAETNASASSAVTPIRDDRPADRPAPAGGASSDSATADGDDTSARGRPDSDMNGGDRSSHLSDSIAAVPTDVVSEQAATAQWFVTDALDGRLGDAHLQAAQTAVTVATEHGFADDPTRVAEALVVFLHPDHR